MKVTAILNVTPIIYSMWNCSNCGAPNSVPRDEGCTNCNY